MYGAQNHVIIKKKILLHRAVKYKIDPAYDLHMLSPRATNGRVNKWWKMYKLTWPRFSQLQEEWRSQTRNDLYFVLQTLCISRKTTHKTV